MRTIAAPRPDSRAHLQREPGSTNMPDAEDALGTSIGSLGCLLILACGLIRAGGTIALFHDYFEWHALDGSVAVFLLIRTRAGLPDLRGPVLWPQA